MREYTDIDISGKGTVSGGRCGTLSISGAGKVEGSLVCESAEISGAGTVSGDLTVSEGFCCDGGGKVEGSFCARSVEVDGALRVERDFSAETVEVSGALKVEGSFHAASLEVDGSCKTARDAEITEKLEIDGTFRTEGRLTTGELEVDGTCVAAKGVSARMIHVEGVLKAEADVQTETLYADGALKIDGLLNAETAEIWLKGDSYIESIGGGRVQVRRSTNRFELTIAGISLQGLFGNKKKNCHLAADVIEADEIELECTGARIVRGVNVHIGPDCEIERVEYSGTLTTDANTTVREKVKI